MLMFFSFNVPLMPSFIKLDFSELPVMLCGFYLGPSATVACEAVKIILKLMFKGTSTAFVGDFANFVVGCSFVLPATIWYHAHKSKHSAIIGLVLGTLSMSVFGSAFNAVYLLPKFAELYGMLLFASQLSEKEIRIYTGTPKLSKKIEKLSANVDIGATSSIIVT